MTVRKAAGPRRREIADAALKVIAAGARPLHLARHRPGGGRERRGPLPALRVQGRHRSRRHRPRGGDPLHRFSSAGPGSIDRLGHFFRRRIEVIRENPGVAVLVGSEQLAQAAPPRGVARVAEFRAPVPSLRPGMPGRSARAGAPGRGGRPGRGDRPRPRRAPLPGACGAWHPPTHPASRTRLEAAGAGARPFHPLTPWR